jgi:drug/metabolite transporter (DMT)-like permease
MTNNNIRGVGFIVLGLLIFSLQDIAVKWISGNYSILQIVFFRTLVAIPCTVLFFRIEGGRGLPRTPQPKLEVVRGFLLFLSFTTHMMGLAALPLAEIAAIRNSGPLVITLLSVVLLSENVGLPRWVALVVGFLGVLLIVQPGSVNFNLGALFMLLSTLFYALSVMLTRRLRTTDSSATMAYFGSFVYLAATVIVAPLAIVAGESPDANAGIAFLFRAWSVPAGLDFIIMCGLGLTWACGMYFMARAYTLSAASVIAPFEYVTLPINVVWGLLLWREFPSSLTWVGALLTVLSGLFILYQEQRERAMKLA